MGPGSRLRMYSNSSYRATGGNNFLWVVLSALIIFILLFAVYINNQSKLTPVLNEVSQLPVADTTAAEEYADTLPAPTVVEPAAPTPAPVQEPATAPVAEAPKTEVKPAETPAKAEVKPEAKPEPKPEVKAEPAKAASGGIIVDYEIQKGDVMGRILSRYGNTKEEVMERNKLDNLDKIKLGQVLKMRLQAQHKVGKNETVASLATKYKVDADRIKKVNSLKDDKLKADQVVLIPLP